KSLRHTPCASSKSWVRYRRSTVAVVAGGLSWAALNLVGGARRARSCPANPPSPCNALVVWVWVDEGAVMLEPLDDPQPVAIRASPVTSTKTPNISAQSRNVRMPDRATLPTPVRSVAPRDRRLRGNPSIEPSPPAMFPSDEILR